MGKNTFRNVHGHHHAKDAHHRGIVRSHQVLTPPLSLYDQIMANPGVAPELGKGLLITKLFIEAIPGSGSGAWPIPLYHQLTYHSFNLLLIIISISSYRLSSVCMCGRKYHEVSQSSTVLSLP